jgi:hypothetical protein
MFNSLPTNLGLFLPYHWPEISAPGCLGAIYYRDYHCFSSHQHHTSARWKMCSGSGRWRFGILNIRDRIRYGHSPRARQMVFHNIITVGDRLCHWTSHRGCFRRGQYLALDFLAESAFLCSVRCGCTYLSSIEHQRGIGLHAVSTIRLVCLFHIRGSHHQLSHSSHMGKYRQRSMVISKLMGYTGWCNVFVELLEDTCSVISGCARTGWLRDVLGLLLTRPTHST